jgi:5-methylcytosine-specific restriction endonuclease McrA
VYCGKSQQDGATLHVDHVVPVIDGGDSEDGNLVTACDECNLGKGRDPLP